MLRFNFAELKESTIEKYFKPDLLLLILTVITVIGVYLYMESSLKKEIAQIESKIQALRAEQKKLQKIHKQEKKLLKKKRELKEKLAVVEALNNNREVPKALYFFNFTQTPQNITMRRLAINGAEIEVSGETEELTNLANFIQEIEKNIGRVKFKQSFRWQTIPIEGIEKPIYRFELKVEQENGSLE